MMVSSIRVGSDCVRGLAGAVAKTALLSLFATLCSCGLTRHPLKPVLTADVKKIEMAELEVNHVLLIRRLNPLFAVMGSSGMVLDAVVVAKRAYKYEKQAGPVNRMCIETFTKTLAQALHQRGFQVGLSQKPYWDYYKKKQQAILKRSDAIFRIKLKQMGFWSPGFRHPFTPSVFVQAELIEPQSRDVLYSDRFAIGMDAASLKLMSLNFGKASVLPNPDPAASYWSFNELLEKSDQSREALLQVITLAARRIAKGFGKRKNSTRAVYHPSLLRTMPDIPLSGTIKPDGLHFRP